MGSITPLLLFAAGGLVVSMAPGATTRQVGESPPAAAIAAEPPLFVILAPAEWCGAVEALATARRPALRVEVTALEDALSAEGGDDPPERIKRHLHRAWDERGARYALLVGDADVFPVRFMVLDRCTEPAFHTAFYPSDLYYADVAEADGSFDDWNAERAGHRARYYGEVRGECTKDARIDFDRVSYTPELAVGRWPVSTRAELEAIVAKTIVYGAEPRVDAARSALFAHADGWIDARERVTSCAAPLGARGFRVELQLYGTDGLPSHASVLAALQRGPTLTFHVGHGSEESWDRCLGPSELAALTASPPTVYFSVGCSTAHFVCEPPYQAYLDEHGVPHRGTNAGEVFTAPPPPPHWLQPGRFDAPGLGERLVLSPTGGAVVYIGCTTGAQPCGLTLLDGFTRAVAEAPDARVGDAWCAALQHYVVAERLHELVPDAGWYPPSIFFQGMKFVLLGDPTIALR